MATQQFTRTRQIPQEGKFIRYDGDGGYEGYFDGQLKVCGQYRSRVESELDQFVSDLIRDDMIAAADEDAEGLVTSAAGDLELTVDRHGSGALLWRKLIIDVEPGDLSALRQLLMG
jgi:hypothetical protein